MYTCIHFVFFLQWIKAPVGLYMHLQVMSIDTRTQTRTRTYICNDVKWSVLTFSDNKCCKPPPHPPKATVWGWTQESAHSLSFFVCVWHITLQRTVDASLRARNLSSHVARCPALPVSQRKRLKGGSHAQSLLLQTLWVPVTGTRITTTTTPADDGAGVTGARKRCVGLGQCNRNWAVRSSTHILSHTHVHTRARARCSCKGRRRRHGEEKRQDLKFPSG